MYINKIIIQNYRNFLSSEIEMKPFTLVIGENNIGKTNILNAIGLIFSQEITFFKKRFLEIDDFNYDIIKSFKEKVADKSILNLNEIELPSVKIEAFLKDFTDEQAAIVADWCINRELTKAKIVYEFSPQVSFKKEEWIQKQRERASLDWTMIDFPIDAYEYTIYGGDDTSNRCDMYFLRMLKMEFLDALRDAKKELVANSDSRLLYKILNRKELSNYNKIKEILGSLTKELKEDNQNLKDIKEDVNKLLDKVSLADANTVNEIDFNFTSPETSEILKKLSITYGSNPISVERNGLGRNNLLYISLLLSQIIEEEKMKAEQKIRDFTAFRLIAIEEPEAHLHPNLQNHLAENIEGIGKDKKHLQLILTSHSSHITSKLSLANTLVLFKEGKLIKSHYILNGLDKKQDEKSTNYLAKYLDATKSTLFFSRKIILVEGISEQLLMPIFFEKVSGKTLEKENCTVVNVNGVAFEHFLKVVKNGLFVKCVVFTDSDTSKKTKNRAPALKRAYSSLSGLIDIQISYDETFEKDLIRSNKSGIGKSTLLDILERTKKKLSNKQNVTKFRTTLETGDIDVDAYFKEIENYKSEFAFNLLDKMREDLKIISVPTYIQNGLDFLAQ
ncbi:AAA family ATPase [Algoriphagus sp. D3-2-R+10]|uniref:ATP-dependent nuclease n=1 Tax=Algoriphagus aurantiacus TaxID=3103948 RepID=UPI002B37E58A|nr:AAA family ATPase [Algoriphagus sp. D3-2-R+10]MEB2774554.1 AAA family ATPase [Algoriphagus sp. D3-2-R+10]